MRQGEGGPRVSWRSLPPPVLPLLLLLSVLFLTVFLSPPHPVSSLAFLPFLSLFIVSGRRVTPPPTLPRQDWAPPHLSDRRRSAVPRAEGPQPWRGVGPDHSGGISFCHTPHLLALDILSNGTIAWYLLVWHSE
ncbi:hypothetical protein O3P69_002706 [Scylla paramamosain]|uniref:Uncharacterized protein n=1 Tax=Scylla paramamosain TaxID=85552 RepID=A0AAW0USC8_SCYPA